MKAVNRTEACVWLEQCYQSIKVVRQGRTGGDMRRSMLHQVIFPSPGCRGNRIFDAFDKVVVQIPRQLDNEDLVVPPRHPARPQRLLLGLDVAIPVVSGRRTQLERGPIAAVRRIQRVLHEVPIQSAHGVIDATYTSAPHGEELSASVDQVGNASTCHTHFCGGSQT
jgi:hypothetical protein